MDKNVRGVFFDPRCGWALISGGLYLGTCKSTSRTVAMSQLATREVRYGLREKAGKADRTPARVEAFARSSVEFNEMARQQDAYAARRTRDKG